MAFYDQLVNDVGKMLGFRVGGQEKIPENFVVQKGGFLEAQGFDLWPERAAPGA